MNLGAPFRIRAGTDIEAGEYADGVVLTTPTRDLDVSSGGPSAYHSRTATIWPA